MRNQNTDGEELYNVGLTMAELEELVLLIDDGEVDEDFLRGIRKKLVNRRKRFRRCQAEAQK